MTIEVAKGKKHAKSLSDTGQYELILPILCESIVSVIFGDSASVWLTFHSEIVSSERTSICPTEVLRLFDTYVVAV